MGITYTELDDRPTGGVQREIVAEAQFDGSYTAGGEALAAGDVGLGTINNVTVESVATDSGYVVRWDYDAGTLVVFEATGSAGALSEAAGGTDLSGEAIRIAVRGRS